MNSTLLLLTIQNELERVLMGRRIPPLRRAHLWLGVKPHQDLSQPIRDAVCLAYFKACDLMRRKAYAMAMETGWTDMPKKRPTRGCSPFGKPSPPLLEWEAQDQSGCLLRRK